MPSNSSSSTSYHSSPNPSVMCLCGIRAPLRTSSSEDNPGRRFFGCINYKEYNGCTYFDWFDAPTCARGMDYGRKMVRKNLALEAQIAEFKKTNEAHIAKLKKSNESLIERIEELLMINEEQKHKMGRQRVVLEALTKKSTVYEANCYKMKIALLVLFLVVICLWVKPYDVV
ncbi:hypothetical protein RHMOL_Rhmol13G0154600 [Rhododendron molle]|uniref:Uncharacterized protein n=1 Tax=Rhododendron molle TaxID=49168 RepID=A0ACC0L7J0_RHOML|nr:hypothetical protein RHMOL_Rhmol13G0154600 [Rhododendron molle]